MLNNFHHNFSPYKTSAPVAVLIFNFSARLGNNDTPTKTSQLTDGHERHACKK